MSKTIVEKLNLQKYKMKAVLQQPEGENRLAGLDAYDTELQKGGQYDLIFAFVLDMESLQLLVHTVIKNNYLSEGGYLYAAYPKKGNKVYATYIHRDHLFEGLGADEENTASSKASQSVDDYIAMIPNVEQDLQAAPDVLAFYQSLTPGYQKDWGALCIQCCTGENERQTTDRNERDFRSRL